MKKVIEFLQGKKTHSVGVLGLGICLAYGLGVIDWETTKAILSALGFGGLIALRDALSRTR